MCTLISTRRTQVQPITTHISKIVHRIVKIMPEEVTAREYCLNLTYSKVTHKFTHNYVFRTQNI